MIRPCIDLLRKKLWLKNCTQHDTTGGLMCGEGYMRMAYMWRHTRVKEKGGLSGKGCLYMEKYSIMF